MSYRLELLLDDFLCLLCFTLREGLADTEDDREAIVKCDTCLLSYEFGGLMEEGTTLGVAYLCASSIRS